MCRIAKNTKRKGCSYPQQRNIIRLPRRFKSVLSRLPTSKYVFALVKKKVLCPENAVFSIMAFSTSALCECFTTTNVSSTKNFSEE